MTKQNRLYKVELIKYIISVQPELNRACIWGLTRAELYQIYYNMHRGVRYDNLFRPYSQKYYKIIR